jgi:hypothetical protein
MRAGAYVGRCLVTASAVYEKDDPALAEVKSQVLLRLLKPRTWLDRSLLHRDAKSIGVRDGMNTVFCFGSAWLWGPTRLRTWTSIGRV